MTAKDKLWPEPQREESKELVEVKPYVLMDREDDAQIAKELMGEVADALVYRYEDRGRKIEGLSKVGVDSAVRELGQRGEVLRELDCEVYRDADAYEFTVTVGRFSITSEGKEVLLDTAKGFKRQARNFASGAPNPFFFEQGAIKACRNARRRLLPEALVQLIIASAGRQGKVQRLAPAKAKVSGGQATQVDHEPEGAPQPLTQQELGRKALKLGYDTWVAVFAKLGISSFPELEEVGYEAALVRLAEEGK